MATQAAISFWHFSPHNHAFLTAGAEKCQSSGSNRLTDHIESQSEATLYNFYTFQLTVNSFSTFSAGVRNTFCVHFAVFERLMKNLLPNAKTKSRLPTSKTVRSPHRCSHSLAICTLHDHRGNVSVMLQSLHVTS